MGGEGGKGQEGAWVGAAGGCLPPDPRGYLETKDLWVLVGARGYWYSSCRVRRTVLLMGQRWLVDGFGEFGRLWEWWRFWDVARSRRCIRARP